MSNAAKKNNEVEQGNMELLESHGSDSYFEMIKKAQIYFEFDKNLKIEQHNDLFARFLGYSGFEINGKSVLDFAESAYAESEECRKIFDKLLQGENGVAELKLLSKNGREIWLSASFCASTDSRNKAIKYFAIGTDISAIKADLKVRVDIMNLTSVVSEADLKGDIVVVNDKFCELSQYSREELLGRPHNTTRHPDMPKEVFKQLWSTIGRGQIFRGVVKNRKKDGTPYYVDAVIAPIIGENGKPKKYIGVRYDITEAEIERHNMRGLFNAIDSTYAYIEFDLNGNILNINKIFESVMGYAKEEVAGKHHRIFVDPAYASKNEYSQFWADLKSGQSKVDVFKRFTKSGKEVWLQAVYTPVKDEVGRVQKVVKIAMDVTKDKLIAADNAGKIAAINRAQAVIEFNPDGTIIEANENFLKTLNYSKEEIIGKHHRMFCDGNYTQSNEYRMLWEKLNRGELEAGEFKRYGKGGKEVWINASYNPIFDISGKVCKVVKFATDITHVKTMIHSVEETARILSSSSQELTATASEMSNAASQTNKESIVASSAAEEVAAGVQTVAANIEEMVASIKEISRSTSESSDMAKTTLQKAQETNKTISQLGVSSQEIGDVIKVISSIAQQTNLLALNATIEAARAGEAGRGFAVVANEVKELAKQTAKATNEITNKIGAIQKDTHNAISAIAGISEAVEKLNGISGVIAAAVEEQTATTNEVSRVVVESRKGVENIASTIKNVSQTATNSTVASDQTLASSRDLAQLASKLNQLVMKQH